MPLTPLRGALLLVGRRSYVPQRPEVTPRRAPTGLEAGDIGEFARIIAVADVVEAMSSDRPYRPVIGIEAALEEIEQGRGVRFDGRVVDVCLHLFRDEGFTFTEQRARARAAPRAPHRR